MIQNETTVHKSRHKLRWLETKRKEKRIYRFRNNMTEAAGL